MSSQLGAAELGGFQLGGLSDPYNLTPAAATLTYTGGMPIVELNTIYPDPASLVYTGGTPVVSLDLPALTPAGADLTYTGGTPVVTIAADVSPAPASLVYTGGTPIINIVSLNPAPYELIYHGGQPGVSLVRTVGVGMQLWIGDVEYGLAEEPAANIVKTLSSPWSATFAIYHSTGDTFPQPGEEVAFFFDSVKRFGGLVLNYSETSIPGSFTVSKIQVRCTGFQNYCDRVIVAKLYTLPIGGVPAIIIFNVWEEHLAQFGISIVYPQGPITGIPEQLYWYITGTEVFQKLKDLVSGSDWYISDNKELIWGSFGTLGAAPFTLRNNDNNVDQMDTTLSNTRFRNRQWVLPSADLQALRVEPTTAIAGQTAFITTYNLTSTPIVKVNGVLQTVDELGSLPPGWTVYFIDNGTGVFFATAPGAGAIIQVAYPNPFPLGYSAQDDASIAAVGLYEAVAQPRNVPDASTAVLMAEALLEYYSQNGFPEAVRFSYNSVNQTSWLTPGMTIDVDRTFPTALGIYTIEQVSSILDKLTVWRHTVTLRLGPGDVTDELILAKFRSDSRLWVNTPPIVGTFEIGIDQSIFVGLQPNTLRLRGSGVIGGWDARFYTNPPVGSDIVIDLLLNGTSIFPPGYEITIPDGASAEQSGIVFTSENLSYVDGDIIQMNILQVGSTTPGKNGLIHVNYKPNTALPPG